MEKSYNRIGFPRGAYSTFTQFTLNTIHLKMPASIHTQIQPNLNTEEKKISARVILF